MSKPCLFCKKPAELSHGAEFFDWRAVFSEWATRNKIISPDRCRFDGVRDRLAWAALDENNAGAHAACALDWAVRNEDYATRYPARSEPEPGSGASASDERPAQHPSER